MRAWVLVSLFLLLVVPATALAQCTPPASGEWFVNETETCSGDTLVLNGNLVINESGSLTLDNSLLQLNSTSDGE